MTSPRSAGIYLPALGGLLMAGVVAAVSFPLVQESRRADEVHQAQALELVARMTAARMDSGALIQLRGGVSPVKVQGLLDEMSILGDVDQMAVMAFDGGDTIIGRTRSGASLRRDGPVGASLDGEAQMDTAVAACDPSRVRSGELVRVRSLRLDGLAHQAVCMPVPDGEGNTVGMVVVLSEAIQSSDLTRLGRRTWVAAVVGGLLAVVAIFEGIRRLLLPLRVLDRAARRLAAGEADVRVQPEGPDEVRRLSTTLNAMAVAVENREQALRDRLESMLRFARMVAHEVRDHLHPILLEVSLADSSNDVERREHLSRIRTLAHGLEGKVQRFLRSPGPVEVNPVATDLVFVIREALVAVSVLAEQAGVVITCDGPDHIDLALDKQWMGLAFENLLRNAIQAVSTQIPPSGSDLPSPEGRVQVSFEDGPTGVMVRFDDNGPGVPPAKREAVFDAYYTERKGGFGLGLFLVRKVVEDHRGRVRCHVAPLGGARFEVWLPRSQATSNSREGSAGLR